MLEYNLTQRERQIVVRLIELSQQSKEQFEAAIIDAAATGPTRELARLDFGGEDRSMQVTMRDLRVLKDEGLIYFRWDQPDRGTGRLSSRAFEAARVDFSHAPSNAASAATAATAATAAAAAAATMAATAATARAVSDEEAIALRFSKITAELVRLARQLIDADEALAADHEARSIAEELAKPVPDETIITRKAKGFVTRLALTFSGTADLAAKGGPIGEYGERLAAWLVALSVWTEWRVAHRDPADPC